MSVEFVFANNVVTRLATGISTVATEITVTEGDGALFPDPDAYQQFAILLRGLESGAREIAYCTGRVGDTLTVLRAQEGTSALSFAEGDEVSMPLTKGILETLRDTA